MKHILLKAAGLLAFLSALALAEPVPQALLELSWESGKFTLTDYRIQYAEQPAYVPTASEGLRIEFLDENRRTRATYRISDPRIGYVDELREGQLVGEQIILDETRFTLVLPVPETPRELVLSDGTGFSQAIKLETGESQARPSITQTKPEATPAPGPNGLQPSNAPILENDDETSRPASYWLPVEAVFFVVLAASFYWVFMRKTA